MNFNQRSKQKYIRNIKKLRLF